MNLPRTAENTEAVSVLFIRPFKWNILKKTNSDCKIVKRN